MSLKRLPKPQSCFTFFKNNQKHTLQILYPQQHKIRWPKPSWKNSLNHSDKLHDGLPNNLKFTYQHAEVQQQSKTPNSYPNFLTFTWETLTEQQTSVGGCRPVFQSNWECRVMVRRLLEKTESDAVKGLFVTMCPELQHASCRRETTTASAPHSSSFVLSSTESLRRRHVNPCWKMT